MVANFTDEKRLYDEAEDELRNPFQRDRDRIIHSRSFRRLKHKTQVFVNPESDHPRTRLTHTIEVSQIARTIACALSQNENLTEAIALAHDLGHSPFGHGGEKALEQSLQNFLGGSIFDHNIQTLRIITKLEKRAPEYHGLNLTKAVIEGTIKHSFPTASHPYVKKLCTDYQITLQDAPTIEAQIAGIADDIAYNHHDMDDGLRANLFTLDEVLAHLPFTKQIFQRMKDRSQNNPDNSLIIHMSIGALIGETITDFVKNSRKILKNHRSEKPYPILSFSNEMAERQKIQKQFLMQNMYRHDNVVHENNLGAEIIKKLFHYFVSNPEKLPPHWQEKFYPQDKSDRFRIIADYIAGMTDSFAKKQIHLLGL